MRAFRVEDLPIESKMLTKALDEAQRKVENYFFDIRKQLFEYDEVLNSQRDRVYVERRRALESDSLESLLIEYAELTMDDILEVTVVDLKKMLILVLSCSYHLPALLMFDRLLFMDRQILVLMCRRKAGILKSSLQNFNSEINCSDFICVILLCSNFAVVLLSHCRGAEALYFSLTRLSILWFA